MPIKECPKGKILNVLSNRCVKIDGIIGKLILKNKKDKKLEFLSPETKPKKDKKIDFLSPETKPKKDKKLEFLSPETKPKKDKKIDFLSPETKPKKNKKLEFLSPETKPKKDKKLEFLSPETKPKKDNKESFLDQYMKYVKIEEDMLNRLYHKSIIFKDHRNNFFLIKNESIINNLTNNDVILDPAGLKYMKKSFNGAGAASAAIYNLLSTSKPNKEVRTHFLQFNTEDDLYENNRTNKKIAIFSKYGNYNIIHVVGPDFTSSKYLSNILTNKHEGPLIHLFLQIYSQIYEAFINEHKHNNNLRLRLLPISSGVFIGNNKEYKIKIFKALKNVYTSLKIEYKLYPIIYFYDKEDYELFKKA
jgi:hypothetical protein